MNSDTYTAIVTYVRKGEDRLSFDGLRLDLKAGTSEREATHALCSRYLLEPTKQIFMLWLLRGELDVPEFRDVGERDAFIQAHKGDYWHHACLGAEDTRWALPAVGEA
jgi:hypothetical protein